MAPTQPPAAGKAPADEMRRAPTPRLLAAAPATPPEGGACWRVRAAVRTWRRAHPRPAAGPICVALSGGADSLALLAAAVAEFDAVEALVVDHRLQPGSAAVAARAADLARRLGAGAQVLTAEIGTAGGPEAAARIGRYAALDAARSGRPVLLAHTRDDQAETVLLGLARGAGARSLRAMAAWEEPYGRPLLDMPGADTRAACAELGIEPWQDPHNLDPRFRRVRVRRELMPLLADVLGPGVDAALARTAAQLRRDDDHLSELAATAYAAAATEPGDDGHPALRVGVLEGLHPAVLGRVVRHWLLSCGVTELRATQIDAISALVHAWSGQGAVAVSGAPAGGDDGRQYLGDGSAGGGRPFRLMVGREGDRLCLGLRR